MTYQQLYHKLVSFLMTIFCIDQLGTSLTETLQNDLDKLAQWGMQFHPCKCNSKSVTRSKTPFKYNYMYILEGHILESVDTTTYLGIAISSNMTWNAHINNIASKAQKLLGFFF